MTWKSHSIFNGICLYALTQNTAAFLLAAPLSWLPDLVEKAFICRHRGWSHSMVVWTIVLVIASITHSNILILAALSGILHLGADACSITGVPILAPAGPRIALRLYHTGTITEFVFLMAFIAVGIALASFR